MRTRSVPGSSDIQAVIDLNCDPTLTPDRLAEARRYLHEALGPFGEVAARACAQAAAARRQAAALQAEIDRMIAGTQLRGIVTGTVDGRARVVLGGTERLLPRPDGLPLAIGQTVLTDAEGRTVLGAGDWLVGGHAYVFCERLEERYALVRSLREAAGDDARQLALVSDAVDLDALGPGEIVLGWSLDQGNVVLVTRRLGAAEPPATDDAGSVREVAREDIVGLEPQLERLELLFVEPPSAAYEPLLAEAQRGLCGAVLAGVSGSGKTTVAFHLVGVVRRRGGQALYRTAPYYLSKWVGEGAARMRADFARLEAAFAASGVRPLLVIDELEAIALDRSQGWMLGAGHLDVLDQLLDLVTRSCVRVLGISNVADRFLDTAVVRDGRMPIVRFPSTLEAEQVTALVARCLAHVSLAAPEGE